MNLLLKQPFSVGFMLYKIFFLIWTIRFGRSLSMLVIPMKKCTGSMDTIVISSSFEHYYSLYQRQSGFMGEYADGKVEKELNRQRYLYPLEAVGSR